jgi:hypothetical protein
MFTGSAVNINLALDNKHSDIYFSLSKDGEPGANNHASYESHLGSANNLTDAIEQYTDYTRTDE